jgi:hypothetical protein
MKNIKKELERFINCISKKELRENKKVQKRVELLRHYLKNLESECYQRSDLSYYVDWKLL